MRRLVLLSAAIVLLASAGTAQALHSGPELRTYGKGTVGNFRFDFDARLGPHEATDLFGEPHGHMKFENFAVGASATAEVTCLSVVGNQATVGGRITRASGLFSTARTLIFFVEDNTLASGMNLGPDRFAGGVFIFDPPPQVCPPPTPILPIDSGDIVVEQN